MVEKIIVNVSNKTYDIYWKGKTKPTHVECYAKACLIDGKHYDYSFFATLSKEHTGLAAIEPDKWKAGQRQLFLSSGDNYNLPVAQG